MVIVTHSPDQLQEAAEQIISFAADERVFLFYGSMGAGKTTLIKSICERLGVKEPVSSPTFSIINEYAGASGSIFHFDFYRLKTETEALDMGYEEYFYSGNYCFIEWPEKIAGLLPGHYVRVDLNVLSNNERLLTFTKI